MVSDKIELGWWQRLSVALGAESTSHVYPRSPHALVTLTVTKPYAVSASTWRGLQSSASTTSIAARIQISSRTNSHNASVSDAVWPSGRRTQTRGQIGVATAHNPALLVAESPWCVALAASRSRRGSVTATGSIAVSVVPALRIVASPSDANNAIKNTAPSSNLSPKIDATALGNVATLHARGSLEIQKSTVNWHGFRSEIESSLATVDGALSARPIAILSSITFCPGVRAGTIQKTTSLQSVVGATPRFTPRAPAPTKARLKPSPTHRKAVLP